MLVVLAVALAIVSWDSCARNEASHGGTPDRPRGSGRTFSRHTLWSKTNKIAELRGLVHGIEHRANSDQDAHQLDQLFSLISRSQQGYRDLIDTFDDYLFSVALDGKILAVNRSFADLVHCSLPA